MIFVDCRPHVSPFQYTGGSVVVQLYSQLHEIAVIMVETTAPDSEICQEGIAESFRSLLSGRRITALSRTVRNSSKESGPPHTVPEV